MATYAIGDVQGCYDALQRLLEAIRFDPASDHLWFCGDLVNRGGQSLETLRLVRSLEIHSVVVLGNHDLSLLSIAQRKRAEQERVNEDLRRVLFAEDGPELLDWLRHRPLLHVDRALGWLLVHAGLAPKWTVKIAENRAREVERALQGKQFPKLLRQMYGDRPSWSPKLKGAERYRAIINVFTRMRYCTPQGRIAFDYKGRPGTQRAGLYPWFEVPGHAERELRIVCGHWSTLGLFRGLGVHAIDTGAVWGGKLTALELCPAGQEPRVIQVAGRAVSAATAANGLSGDD
jgi:bis(5'-nucleosyl)-tetraphosphatase (symmetrical)